MIELVFVEQSPSKGRIIHVADEAIVGREGADVILSDPEVSRRHALLRELPSGPAIEDMGSTNGTFVNGVRIEELTELREGDEVRIGDTVWRLEAPWAATQVSMETPATHPPA